MAYLVRVSTLLLAGLCVGACTSRKPEAALFPYPCSPAIANAQGKARSDAMFYLPAADSLYRLANEYDDWTNYRMYFEHLSGDLTGFQAPVLANCPLPGKTYRALRHSGFEQVRLYTLRQLSGQMPTVTVQVLNHHNYRQGGPQAPPPPPPKLSIKSTAPSDTTISRANRALDRWLHGLAQTEYTCTTTLTAAQWATAQRTFASFRSRQPVRSEDFECCDGVGWLLEAQTGQGYWFAYRRDGAVPRQRLFTWLESLAPLPAGL